MRKRLIACFLTCCLLFTLLPGVHAAADLRTASGFYAKQQTSSTCTLASAAMMMRRRAYLDGLDDWASLTESSLRRVAWSYVGLSHDFSMMGITVLHGAFDSGASVETQLRALLQAHPEGVVVYDRHVPHAVLVTDYTDGQFYGSDPSSTAPSGRIPASQFTISLANANFYWYVAADANVSAGGSLHAQDVYYPERLTQGTAFASSGTLTSPGVITDVTLSILAADGSAVQTVSAQPNSFEYDLSALSGQLHLETLATGGYSFCLAADDDAGGHIRLKKEMLVTTAESAFASYSGTVPALSDINAIGLTEEGFDVEVTATDSDDSVSTVLFSSWADGSQFGSGMIGARTEDLFTVRIDAPQSLGIRNFMVNITAMDSDGNYTKAALLVRVSSDDSDLLDGAAITADQLLL